MGLKLDPEIIGPDGQVSVVDLQHAAGVTRKTVVKAIDAGLVTPTGTRKPGSQGGRPVRTCTVEDAVLFIAAATLAVAIGVAVVTMLRTLRQSGAKLSDGAVVIPLPTDVPLARAA